MGALRNQQQQQPLMYSPPPPYTPTAPPINYQSDREDSVLITPRQRVTNETPRMRPHMNFRSRSGQLRRSEVLTVTPPRESSSSSSAGSSSEESPSQQPPQSRLYPSLSFSSTDSPNTICPLKKFGIPTTTSRSAYA